jgi:hypothetical protein
VIISVEHWLSLQRIKGSPAPTFVEPQQSAFLFDLNILYEHLEKLNDIRDRRSLRYSLAIALVLLF